MCSIYVYILIYIYIYKIDCLILDGGDIKCHIRKINLLLFGSNRGGSLADCGPLAEYKNVIRAIVSSKVISEKIRVYHRLKTTM